jgi:hypothetical protein
VKNECSDTVQLTGFDLRLPEPAFSVVTSAPVDVPVGTEAFVDVQFTPQKDGLTEEVLFLQVAGPFTERRPVTLYGYGH